MCCAIGHSAGAQLALWLAARSKLPVSSDAYSADPLPLRGVVSLAGITDLRSYALGGGSCNAAVRELMGGTPRSVGERYAQTNPWDLLPLGLPLRFVHGGADTIVPITQSRRLAGAESKTNAAVELRIIHSAGHFDVIAPFSPTWPVVERYILELALPAARD